MIYNKLVENIILEETYFTVFSSGGAQQIFNYEKLEKVYISVHKKSKNYIIIRTIIPLLLLFFFMQYLNTFLSIFIFIPGLLLLTIKLVSHKQYLFVVKYKTGATREYIVMPKLKLRLIDKMRNVRAAIDAQNFQKVFTKIAV